MASLTTKQKRFALIYDGNGVAAAKEAGYGGDKNTLNQIAIKNLANPKVREIIDSRESERNKDKIATREDRQKFWTRVMYDSAENMSVRLQASKLLGKSQADFVERQEIKTENEHRAVIKMPKITAEEWEEMFEAQLNKEV